VADTLEYNGDKVLITRVALEIDKLRMINDFVVKASLISSLVGVVVAAIIAFAYTTTLMKPISEMEKQLKKTMEENKKAEQIVAKAREDVIQHTRELEEIKSQEVQTYIKLKSFLMTQLQVLDGFSVDNGDPNQTHDNDGNKNEKKNQDNDEKPNNDAKAEEDDK
jgi:mannitol-specific phosphotransferase system IIBC component